MSYTKQGFANFGDPLTAEQLIKIEDAIIGIEQTLESGYRRIGTTPLITTQGYSSIKLSASESTAYSITSPTVWNFESVSETPTFVKCTYTREEDRHVITSDAEDIEKWYSAHMIIMIDNLVVGQEYKIISPVCSKFIIASDAGEINLCSYAVLNAANASLVGTKDLSTENGRAWHSFVPTETTAKIRVYPSYVNDAEPYTECTGIFENFVVKRADTDDEIGDVVVITGTVDGDSTIVDNIPKSYLISADTAVEVYGSSTSQSESENTGPLSGKTVVVFGDSIMGMYRGTGSVCYHIANKSGATVYNAGCGGCRMSTSHSNDSFNAWAFPSLVDSVVTNDFSYQENTTPGVDYFAEVTEMLKSLNFNYVDIVLIHYGTNDYNLDAVLDDETDLFNTVTCCGGLRYGVEQLLSNFPQLTIFVSLPCYRLVNSPTGDGTKIPVEESTNEYGQTYQEYSEAIRATAESYNLKIIDSYHELGVNSINHAAYLGDGTHHNKYGRQRLGEFIASELY